MADEAQQGLKDRNLQHYYEAMQAMFATPGWAYLREDAQRIYAGSSTIEGIETMEQLHFRRGQLDILKLLVAQPAVIDAAYDMLLEDENEHKGV